MSFVGRPVLSDAVKASLLERTDQMREVAVNTILAVRLLNRPARSTYPVLITDNETVTSSSIGVNELFV